MLLTAAAPSSIVAASAEGQMENERRSSTRYEGVRWVGDTLHIRYYVGGRRKEEAVPAAKTEKEADDVRRALMLAAQRGEWKPRKERVTVPPPPPKPEDGPKFKELTAVYRKDWMRTRKRQSWQKEMLAILEGKFGKVPLGWLTTARWEKWRDELARKKWTEGPRKGQRRVSDTTIVKYLAFVSGIYRRALETEAGRRLVSENPLSRVRRPATPSRGLKKALSAEQAEALLRHLAAVDKHGRRPNEDLYRWALLVLKVGMRVEEAQHLRWAAFDLRSGVISIADTKTGHPRRVVAPEEVVKQAKQWKLSASSSFVVGNEWQEGVPHRRWTAAYKAAGIPWGNRPDAFTTRNMRTTFTMLSFEHGAKPEDLIEQTGHSLAVLLAYYAEANVDRKRSAVEKNPVKVPEGICPRPAPGKKGKVRKIGSVGTGRKS